MQRTHATLESDNTEPQFAGQITVNLCPKNIVIV